MQTESVCVECLLRTKKSEQEMDTPVTPEQFTVLNSLICERLSSNQDNKTLIQTVVNKRNNNLVEILKSPKAWQEDEDNITAYYLVKSPKGTILSFFSIRCGEVFETLNEELIAQAKQYKDNLIKLQNPSTKNEDKQQAALKVLIAERAGWKPEIAEYYTRKSTRRDRDANVDNNKDNHQVARAFSAVELSILCNNQADGVKEEWNSLGLPRRRGLTIFWHLVVGKIEILVSHVGCGYIYLFAADDESDGELVNYYRKEMFFVTPVKLGANKPSFDYECFFLCQNVKSLLSHRKTFYDTFNKEITDAV